MPKKDLSQLAVDTAIVIAILTKYKSAGKASRREYNRRNISFVVANLSLSVLPQPVHPPESVYQPSCTYQLMVLVQEVRGKPWSEDDMPEYSS